MNNNKSFMQLLIFLKIINIVVLFQHLLTGFRFNL